jgi:DNA-binding XRE family transcriptional regulator
MSASTHPLALYRARHNLSLAKLAEAVGTTRQSLFRIEKGDQKPTFEMMAKIAAATNDEVSANDLVAAVPAHPSPQPPSSEAA